MDDGGDVVEVAGTDFLLVRHEGVTLLANGEFWILNHFKMSCLEWSRANPAGYP